MTCKPLAALARLAIFIAMLAPYRSLLLVLAILPLPTLASAATKTKTPSDQTGQAAAKPPAKTGTVNLGGNNGWEAFADGDAPGRICFLVGKPGKMEPAIMKRTGVSMTVTHRPSHKVVDVVNFVSNYIFKENSAADLDVDGKKFSLFTDRDGAWARDAATDQAIVAAMAKGKEAVIKGTSAKGNLTTDHYNLRGFGSTLTLIDKACGIS